MSSPITVLTVDDDQDVLEALVSDIREIGYQVRSAKNGQEALDILKDNPIDIILSDLNMPVMSGTQLLRALRKNGFFSPFIVLSGYGTREEGIELVRLGAYNFLTKPTPFEVVKSALADAAKYVHVLHKARDEFNTIPGVESMPGRSRVEEAVFALARMGALQLR